MKNFKFFQNDKCEYFPCHNINEKRFNCLFCYCPLYALGDQCGGNFEYSANGIKSCMKCNIPHTERGYDYIEGKIDKIIKLVQNEEN
jgi:Zn-finger protein